jgi:hypothetical protein
MSPGWTLDKAGAPGGIRTPDPLLRRQLLYPLSYGRNLSYRIALTQVLQGLASRCRTIVEVHNLPRA